MIRLKRHIINFLFLTFLIFLFLIISFCFLTNFLQKSPDLPKALTEEENIVYLPILMYHSITERKKYKNKFIIHKNLLKNDLNFLHKNGYNTVLVDDLINFVYFNKSLPEKPIMITFDDGYLNNFLYAYPEFKKYNFKMIFSPIGKFVDLYSSINDRNPYYASVTWDDIEEMVNSGNVELQNHSYDLHKNSKRQGCKKIRNENIESYKKILIKDLNKFQEEVQKHKIPKPTAVVYPFGAYCKESEEEIKKYGFKATFSAEARLNKLVPNKPESLFNLGRYIRTASVPTKIFFKKHNLN